MTDDVQRQITWLLCFDDGEADHIGAARCAETMKSQQARNKELSDEIERKTAAISYAVRMLTDLEGHFSKQIVERMLARLTPLADCDNKPAPTKKPGKAHPWRKTQAPQR